MKKRKVLMMILALFLLLQACFFNQDLFARENETDLGNSKPRNTAKVIIPNDVSREDLGKIKKIAVLIASPFQPLGETATDLLSVKLRDLFQVTEQTKISKTTWEEIRNLQKQEEKNAKQEEILNVVKIGKKLGLDAVITGTLFDGKSQISFSSENPPRLIEKTVVMTFYLQVVDVNTEKVMLAIMLEYDKGENITNAIDVITRVLKEEMTK